MTSNNYTFHERTQQFSMVKRARPFSLRKMAQFGTIPPETGTHMHLFNAEVPGWAGELRHLARLLTLCTIMADLTSRDASSAGQQLSLPTLPSAFLLATYSPKPTPDFQQHCHAKTQLSSLILEVSPRLKCCAIQQMNLLFRFLSLLSYGFQLNIIEAGSWFAVWAI